MLAVTENVTSTIIKNIQLCENCHISSPFSIQKTLQNREIFQDSRETTEITHIYVVFKPEDPNTFFAFSRSPYNSPTSILSNEITLISYIVIKCKNTSKIHHSQYFLFTQDIFMFLLKAKIEEVSVFKDTIKA